MQKPNVIVKAETNPILLQNIVEEVGPRLVPIVIQASARALNRYNIRPGRIFGNPRDKERYKIVQLSGDRVAYKELSDYRVMTEKIDDLLERWAMEGIVELSPIDRILEQIKRWLTPFLGGVLVSALIAWLMKKLG